MLFNRIFAVALGLASISSTLSASAQDQPPPARHPATANVIQFGAGFRYGFELNEGDFNPWGLGLGLEGGITLPNAVYLGANFDYFFGDKQETGGIELSGNIFQLMAEGGYDLGLGDSVVIRPKAGLGFAHIKQERCISGGDCADDSATKFALAPGATFLVITPKLSLSVDLRYDLIFAEETAKALILSAGIGF